MGILNALLYYLIILPISALPFFVLHGVSNVLYVAFYYFPGYRKKVVLKNLRNSFPDKSEKEIQDICKKFYKHFSDLIVESIKTFTITKRQVLKRVKCINPEVLDKYFDQHKTVMIAGGHLNNWELFAVAVDNLVKHKAVGIYKPLTNKFFDKKMQVTRGKYGLILLAIKKVKQFMDDNLNNPMGIIFAIDQSPSNPENAYWMRFLNQDTGVAYGIEKYAREYNYPVVYGRINKVKRGYYTFEFFDITDNPKEMKHGEIIERTTHLLEKDIIAAPQYWLWTHKRWKHRMPDKFKK
jgi:KDO2-lipid IV(A) lauroyltransferase